jgi:hypothetical protein
MQHSLMPRAFANSMRHMATSHSLPMIRGLRSEMLAPAEKSVVRSPSPEPRSVSPSPFAHRSAPQRGRPIQQRLAESDVPDELKEDLLSKLEGIRERAAEEGRWHRDDNQRVIDRGQLQSDTSDMADCTVALPMGALRGVAHSLDAFYWKNPRPNTTAAARRIRPRRRPVCTAEPGTRSSPALELACGRPSLAVQPWTCTDPTLNSRMPSREVAYRDVTMRVTWSSPNTSTYSTGSRQKKESGHQVDWQLGWLEHREDAKQHISDPLRRSRSPSPDQRVSKSAPSGGEEAGRNFSHWSRGGHMPQMILHSFSERPPMLLSAEEHGHTAMRKMMNTSEGSRNCDSSDSEWRVRTLIDSSLARAVKA